MSVQSTTTATTPQGIKLSKFISDLNAYDANNDGLFSRQEIAKATLKMTPGSDEFSLGYSLIAGSTNGQGFVDPNGTGLSVSDLAQLAAAGKNSNDSAQLIEVDDFSAMFGSAAQSKTVSTTDATNILTNIANGTNTSSSSSSSSASAILSKLLGSILAIIMQLLQALLGGGNTSTTGTGTTSGSTTV